MDYIKYIPLEMNDITEYKELGTASKPTFDEVKAKMLSIANNHFLSKLDEAGIKRMEKIMDIKGMETQSLDKRRTYIVTKANNILPYTLRNLSSKLKVLLGNDGFLLEMFYSEYRLKITLYLRNHSKLDDVRNLIDEMVPCNIITEILLLYNKYQYFKKYVYGDLTSMTHWYMRTHEFEDGGYVCNTRLTTT